MAIELKNFDTRLQGSREGAEVRHLDPHNVPYRPEERPYSPAALIVPFGHIDPPRRVQSRQIAKVATS